MKADYRSKLGMTFDILKILQEAGEGGIIVSHICRKVNVSHYVVMERLEVLLQSGIVMKREAVTKGDAIDHKGKNGGKFCLMPVAFEIIKNLTDTEVICQKFFGMNSLT